MDDWVDVLNRRAEEVGVPATHPGSRASRTEVESVACSLHPADPEMAPMRYVEAGPATLTSGAHPLSRVPFEELIVERPVGSGGIAELWLARHPAVEASFVAKLGRREFSGNPHVHAQFDREWRSTRLLKHPGIIDHFSRGVNAEGRPFLTMEPVHGYTLTRFVERAVRWKFLRAVLIQLCDVLSYVHNSDVLHQDLKPSNIMVDMESRRIRVTDFGLARFERARPGESTRNVLGTPAYMAPEQARGQLDWLGPHTDLYTVGVLLFELLSGRKPFHDESDRVVMIQHCTNAPPPLEVRAGINAPPGIADILGRLLAKSPQARFKSAAELRRAITALDEP
jgi:serine/threonine-protein kinase